MVSHPVRVILASALLSAAFPLLAGDLNPPGAPRSTPGPEPRIAINDVNTPGTTEALHVITRQGSYYLEENITIGFRAKNGIVIEASNVTVDLNGFTLDGLEVLVIPWPEAADSERSLTGILASGSVENITVMNGTVRDWGRDGIDIWTADINRLENLTVTTNLQTGIRSGDASVITDCVSEGNGDIGFRVGGRSTLIGCVAHANGGVGFGGVTSNLTACTATENGGSGFNLAFGSLVAECVAAQNEGDGIFLNSTGNQALNNTCYNNGYPAGVGAGIHSTGADRIEGNHVRYNPRGIRVSQGTNSLVIRNSASENTVNYDIVGNHAVGPILTGSNPITSVNPWANFSF
jgi:parallel beta-helix repeat protein